MPTIFPVGKTSARRSHFSSSASATSSSSLPSFLSSTTASRLILLRHSDLGRSCTATWSPSTARLRNSRPGIKMSSLSLSLSPVFVLQSINQVNSKYFKQINILIKPYGGWSSLVGRTRSCTSKKYLSIWTSHSSPWISATSNNLFTDDDVPRRV